MAKELIPMGDTVGVQLLYGKVYVTDDILLSNGESITKGSIIVQVNEKEVKTIEDLKQLAQKKNSVTIEVNGQSKIMELNERELQLLTISANDYSEGIGTLTFIDPESNQFGAIGHQIVDHRLSEAPPFSKGYIHEVHIESIKKSEAGKPGFKMAYLNYSQILGEVSDNKLYGIFGSWKHSINESMHKQMTVMPPEEIKIGDAKIWTANEQNEVEQYDIHIDKILEDSIEFTITDDQLLKQTGGIVQGMSGSPITQNDMFVGAVTHMYVEKPESGVGIQILEMLKKR